MPCSTRSASVNYAIRICCSVLQFSMRPAAHGFHDLCVFGGDVFLLAGERVLQDQYRILGRASRLQAAGHLRALEQRVLELLYGFIRITVLLLGFPAPNTAASNPRITLPASAPNYLQVPCCLCYLLPAPPPVHQNIPTTNPSQTLESQPRPTPKSRTDSAAIRIQAKHPAPRTHASPPHFEDASKFLIPMSVLGPAISRCSSIQAGLLAKLNS